MILHVPGLMPVCLCLSVPVSMPVPACVSVSAISVLALSLSLAVSQACEYSPLSISHNQCRVTINVAADFAQIYVR
jgi:hypothetical protein